MLHSGSRNLGYTLAKAHHVEAKNYCAENHIALPTHDLAFLHANTIKGVDYITDMNFCIDFSFENRRCMLECIRIAFESLIPDFKINDTINIHHNYANLETHDDIQLWVHRKGATSAKKGQIGIIPGSMGTSSYIVEGLGNHEAFCSCSHGAGRHMSRTKAKKKYTMQQFEKAMSGVVSEDINRSHLDESPMAYKNIDVVMQEQTDLVKIVHTLKPLCNLKG